MSPGEDMGRGHEIGDPTRLRKGHSSLAYVSTVWREPERRSFSARKATTVCCQAGTSSRAVAGRS